MTSPFNRRDAFGTNNVLVATSGVAHRPEGYGVAIAEMFVTASMRGQMKADFLCGLRTAVLALLLAVAYVSLCAHALIAHVSDPLAVAVVQTVLALHACLVLRMHCVLSHA